MGAWKREISTQPNLKPSGSGKCFAKSTINEIAGRHGISPVMLSRWKTEFMDRAASVFKKGPTDADKGCRQKKSGRPSSNAKSVSWPMRLIGSKIWRTLQAKATVSLAELNNANLNKDVKQSFWLSIGQASIGKRLKKHTAKITPRITLFASNRPLGDDRKPKNQYNYDTKARLLRLGPKCPATYGLAKYNCNINKVKR